MHATTTEKRYYFGKNKKKLMGNKQLAKKCYYTFFNQNLAHCFFWIHKHIDSYTLSVIHKTSNNFEKTLIKSTFFGATLDIFLPSNHNIHKSLYGLCFWASDPLIDRFC